MLAMKLQLKTAPAFKSSSGDHAGMVTFTDETLSIDKQSVGAGKLNMSSPNRLFRLTCASPTVQ